MDDFTIARIIHVVSIVFWIGGVTFATLVVFPMARKISKTPEERLKLFHNVESQFAPMARIWVLLAGLSGFWMVWRAGLWDRFADLHYWWMHAMLIVWLFFMMMLFVIEPFIIHRKMANSTRPAADFDRMERMHQILMVAAIIAVIGAVGGSHALF